MLIHKTIALSDVSLKMQGDTGKFSGYASVFGGVDTYGDTIARGAFVDTLAKKMPKMFFNHQWDMPIGKWTKAEEDSVGLFVEGELTPGLAAATDVRAAMMHETLDGLSIGGMLRKGDYEEKDGVRLIKKWSELVEVSPVVFPADGAARIDLSSVKGQAFGELLLSEIEELETIREFECFLRDAGGLSKGVAKALATRAKNIFERRDAGEDVEAKMLAGIAARVQALACK